MPEGYIPSPYSLLFIRDESLYPMPIYASCRDEVFVGRVRRDFSAENSVNLWIVADNLRRGAATNAVMIAQQIYPFCKFS